jgi:hypothetical protein
MRCYAGCSSRNFQGKFWEKFRKSFAHAEKKKSFPISSRWRSPGRKRGKLCLRIHSTTTFNTLDHATFRNTNIYNSMMMNNSNHSLSTTNPMNYYFRPNHFFLHHPNHPLYHAHRHKQEHFHRHHHLEIGDR